MKSKYWLYGILALAVIGIIFISGFFISGYITSPITSPTFEGAINFKIIERTDKNKLDGPHLYLSVSTQKIYPCANYGIEHSISIKDNTIKVILDLGSITKPNICLTATRPASFGKELDLGEGKYTLEFHSKSKVDKYNITISKEDVLIEKIKATFSKTKQTKIYRTPENLISVECFRYRYGCEKEEEIVNELCPIFFNEIGKIATLADENLVDKRVLGGYCRRKEFDKGGCKLYYYFGDIETLKQILEASNNYDLEHGYKASCRDSNLYYRRIDTWLGHTFVVK